MIISPLLRLLPGAITAFILAGVALAQPAGRSAPTEVSPVTITGVRPADREAIRTIIAPFVDQHAARSRKSGLLVRMPSSGVCPATLGLPPAYDAFVSARIVAVAGLVGAPAAAGACDPNVQVLFTDDPQGVANALARRTRGAIFGLHFVGDDTRLVRVLRPIQAWYVTGTRNATTGSAVTIVGRDGQDSSARVRVDSAYGARPFTGSGSHIPPRNSSEIVNALIIVDARRLRGLPIGPVADYVAALALSQARSLETCGTLPSILDLFAADCPDSGRPQAITDSDIAFLKALYAADITTSGARGSDNVTRAMARDIGEPAKH